MSSFEVPSPILNSPFEEPKEHWLIREGEAPQQLPGRRPSLVFVPRDERGPTIPWDLSDGTLKASTTYSPQLEMVLVNRVRERVKAWREQGYPGCTRVTLELLKYWTREERQQRLFFAQVEAVEAIIFLTEARADFLQGIDVPRDDPNSEGAGFLRYACKMATGSGKTTVMAMTAAWSILNKVSDRGNTQYSDVVLVVCPNVTIRSRLGELDPELGEASLYRTRDLVPAHLMPQLTQGKVLLMNWHKFEKQQTGTDGSRVEKRGVRERVPVRIHIGDKNTTARGKRYLTLDTLEQRKSIGLLTVVPGSEKYKKDVLESVQVWEDKYVESDAAFIRRVLGREIGNKGNLLVINDEAHHAYRIAAQEEDDTQTSLTETIGDEEEAEDFKKEATVWIDGLDRIQKLRGINFCLDLSATPYFLGSAGRETNRPFPWIVSDFGLIDAIESGLTKIPQLATRDATGAEVPGYFNIWKWITEEKMTAGERGGKKANAKPEAVLKYAHVPIAMLAGLWQERLQAPSEDGRPPVFILVCKTVKLAKVVYEWLAEGKAPAGIPPAHMEELRNTERDIRTIRVDNAVSDETDSDNSKSDEKRWMRFTLDTVGKPTWPTDRQGRPIYPEGFVELAQKLKRPLDPPGKDVRCIVSVGMLTEGWDCNTVTHIIGLRPFMSQLLCEQVVGRGLRRTRYDVGEDGKFSEEVATVLGVPFEIVPFKANPTGPRPPPVTRYHVHAIPQKAEHEIRFPRVEGYTQAVKSRVTVEWSSVPPLTLDPMSIPAEVEVKAGIPNNRGRPSVTGPGKKDMVTIETFLKDKRIQQVTFELAAALTRDFASQPTCTVPTHALFAQMLHIVTEYVEKKVQAVPPYDKRALALSPFYGWVVERLLEAIRPDSAQGEEQELPRYEAHRDPGSTADVDFWTSRDVREIEKSHLNYVVADTKKWEQSAAFLIDRNPAVRSFVKNAGLGFAIPYFHNGSVHEYIPDFIIRLDREGEHYLILETKGFDELEEVKTGAAERWVNAVNADGQFGTWRYAITKRMTDIPAILKAHVS